MHLWTFLNLGPEGVRLRKSTAAEMGLLQKRLSTFQHKLLCETLPAKLNVPNLHSSVLSKHRAGFTAGARSSAPIIMSKSFGCGLQYSGRSQLRMSVVS